MEFGAGKTDDEEPSRARNSTSGEVGGMDDFRVEVSEIADGGGRGR